MSPITVPVRNPAAEASAVLGPGHTARVLEPSPPAVDEGPWFADDPAAVGDPEPGTVVVTPTSAGDRTWDEVVAERPDLADFARERWLGARRRLSPAPDGYAAARDDFHRLAYSVVAEARRRANGRFGLRFTAGGFGTPFFGDDVQVRVEGDVLVVQHGDHVRADRITTLRAAGELVGVEPADEAGEHDSPPLDDLDRPLAVTAEVGRFLGDWFGFAWSVLEELRLTPDADDVSRTQLWPGHFDPAIEMGDADAGRRATYGASPGDGAHPGPYLYVAAWGEIDRADPFWNDAAFDGGSLGYAELLAADDPVATALAFFRRGHDILHGHT